MCGLLTKPKNVKFECSNQPNHFEILINTIFTQHYKNMVTFFVKILDISPNGASVPEASESSSPDASTFDSNSSKSLSTSEKKITTQF